MVMNLASCDFALPKKTRQIYFNSIDCTTPSGPDMKYSLLSVLSKWVDSQIGFWTNSDSIRIWTDNSKIGKSDFVLIQTQSEFRIINPNGLFNNNYRKR